MKGYEKQVCFFDATPRSWAGAIVYAIVATALFVAGCEDPEGWGSCDWPWTHSHSTDGAAAETVADDPAPAEAAATAAPSASLVYRYGGFDGSRAAEDPATQIAGLHISRSRLSYKWAKGSLRNWGLADSQAHALACAFYWDGRQWIGGKFDWISTSRTTRDWTNLDGGYHGWNADAFWSAPKRAFCIVSKDGRKRTNLIETTEP